MSIKIKFVEVLPEKWQIYYKNILIASYDDEYDVDWLSENVDFEEKHLLIAAYSLILSREWGALERLQSLGVSVHRLKSIYGLMEELHKFHVLELDFARDEIEEILIKYREVIEGLYKARNGVGK